MTIDASAFDFDTMKQEVGVDPFAQETNKYGRDERFYTLTKDKEGNGAALIRFLPDSEKGMIQKLFKINTTVFKNGKKRFVSEFSPSTIGQPDPFQETWQKLWNEGNKEEAKKYSRSIRYVANIKVLRDPQNPENEGKIFLYEMSSKMKDKIQSAVDPSETDRSLGATPKQVFNPLRGNSFRLVASKGQNDQINYDRSEVLNDVTSIYDSAEEALEDIKNNTYKLSDLLKPENFLSYDELSKKMKWVFFKDMDVQADSSMTAEVSEPEKPDVEVTPSNPAETIQDEVQTKKQEDSLDSLLDGLV